MSLEISFNKNRVNDNLKFFLNILLEDLESSHWGKKSAKRRSTWIRAKAWNGVLPYPHPSLDIITFWKGLCSDMEGMRRDLKLWLDTESSFV